MREYDATWAERLMLTGLLEGKGQTLKLQIVSKLGNSRPGSRAASTRSSGDRARLLPRRHPHGEVSFQSRPRSLTTCCEASCGTGRKRTLCGGEEGNGEASDCRRNLAPEVVRAISIRARFWASAPASKKEGPDPKVDPAPIDSTRLVLGAIRARASGEFLQSGRHAVQRRLQRGAGGGDVHAQMVFAALAEPVPDLQEHIGVLGEPMAEDVGLGYGIGFLVKGLSGWGCLFASSASFWRRSCPPPRSHPAIADRCPRASRPP